MKHTPMAVMGRLESRLTLTSTLVVLGVATTIVFLFHRLSVRSVEDAQRRAAVEVAESIGRRLAAGIPDEALLDSIVSEYVDTNSEIVAASVHILKSDGGADLVASTGMPMERLDEQESALTSGAPVAAIVRQRGERFWSVAVPVVRSGQVVGIVGVWSTLGAAELVTRQTQRLALLVLPPSVILLGVLLSFTFRRVVQRPLDALGVAMGRAEAGDLEAEATVLRRDEIGFIASQYNRMLARIRESREEREAMLRLVQGFNEELTRRVADATTELKERNDELRRLHRELYHLQRRLVPIERESVAKHMSARLAHKIGTPLSLVSGHVQMLQKTRETDAELHGKLALVQSQIDKLTATVRQTLEETRASFRMEPVDLNRLLESIAGLLEPTLSARAVALTLRLEAGASSVDGDEAQLEQVFLSLINNSLDAMPAGGHLTLTTTNGSDIVRVRVEDDGAGIAPDVLPSVFRPFFSTKDPARGTGLGLSIVRELLATHHATCDIRSEQGRGTVVDIEFPVKCHAS